MADASKFLHTWRLRPNSRLLRLYKSAWEADTVGLTFCKLFWGIVFCPVGLFFTKIVFPVIDFLMEWKHSHGAKRASRENPVKAVVVPKPKRVGPSRGEKLLESIGAFFDRVAAFFQRHPGIGKTFGAIGVTLLWVVGIGVVLGALGGLAYGFYVVPGLMGWGFVWTGIGLVGVLVLLGFGALLTWLVDDTYFFNKIGDGLSAFGHFFAAGYYATKYRTCPRVIVDE